VLDFIPADLSEEFTIFQVSRILGVTMEEAGCLDPVELQRIVRFTNAEAMAREKFDYENRTES
jgi:hypothetical protein